LKLPAPTVIAEFAIVSVLSILATGRAAGIGGELCVVRFRKMTQPTASTNTVTSIQGPACEGSESGPAAAGKSNFSIARPHFEQN
jgi:hypothetical protein